MVRFGWEARAALMRQAVVLQSPSAGLGTAKSCAAPPLLAHRSHTRKTLLEPIHVRRLQNGPDGAGRSTTRRVPRVRSAVIA
jgi:hypothetical protein